MHNDDFKMFVSFQKSDPSQRMVYGYASTEAVDSQGEIVDKVAMQKALPNYMQFGNIREMHQLSAVGKAKSAIMDDKGLFLKGKIVDDAAWKKVQEGVYMGFSIGGRIVEKVGNVIKNLVLTEISIVDRPANPEAVFTLVKFDKGGEPMKKQDVTVSPAEPDEDDDSMKYMEISRAKYVLMLAQELVFIYNTLKSEDKPTDEIENAIGILKDLANKTLTEADSAKVAKLFKLKDTAPVMVDMNWQTGYFSDIRKVLG